MSSPRASLLIAILTASCAAERGVELDLRSGRWTPAERASISAMPEVNRPSTNDVIWRATATVGGVTQRICLQDRPFGTFHSSYALCVFGAGGQMLEYNSIPVPDKVVPRSIIGLNPVTVEFVDPDKRDRGPFVRTPDRTTEEFIQFCRNAEPMIQKMKREAMEREGQQPAGAVTQESAASAAP